MTIINTDFRQPIRLASAMVTLTSAVTALLVFTLPGLSGETPATAIIRKVLANNRGTSPVTIQFGSGTAVFTQVYPGLYAINGQDNIWTEDQLPALEFTANITALLTAANTGVDVVIEVDVIPAATGHA